MVGGSINFKNSPVRNLGNLQMVMGALNIKDSKITKEMVEEKGFLAG